MAYNLPHPRINVDVGNYHTFLFELKAQTGFHGHPWDELICQRGLSHHKGNNLSTGGISYSSVCGGYLTILFLLEVNVIRFIMDYMLYRNQQLSGHGHDDLHLVFPPDLCLIVGEPAEEAALCSASRPCALDDVFSEIYVAVGYAT